MHGLYLLWWEQVRGVSPAAVATILATGDLALTSFEVPTGWFADRRGHRISLITDSALQIAGMLLCWFGQGILGVLAATRVRVGTRSQMVLTGIGAVIAAAAFVQSSIFTAAVIALAFLVGLAMPARAAGVQRIAADRVRARAASAASAADKAATSLALIYAGLLRQ